MSARDRLGAETPAEVRRHRSKSELAEPAATALHHPLWFSLLPILIGVLAVSMSSILIKVCLAPAGAIGMYRLAFSTAVLAPFALRQAGALRALTRRQQMAIGLSGVLLGLHFLFWIGSLKRTSIASSMIITALQPPFVAIGAALVFGERIGRKGWASMACALAGAVVIGVGDDHSGGGTLYGDLLSLLGTLAISGYMLAGQTVRARLPSSAYNACVFGIAALTLLACNVGAGVPLAGYREVDWLWLALLALIPTLFGHALFNWLLQYVSATTLSVTILGEPVGAILLAAWLLHNPITLSQALGGAVTLLGVAVFLYRRR
ncbi:MAG: DMT family transporter [Alicyclobacillus sp.]|nr:DMT family transporter [Alicyclobacillus sp.]